MPKGAANRYTDTSATSTAGAIHALPRCSSMLHSFNLCVTSAMHILIPDVQSLPERYPWACNDAPFRLHGGPLEHTDSDVTHQKPSSSTVGHHFEVFCFDATTFRGHGSLDLAGTFFRSIAKHAVFITLYTLVTQPEAIVRRASFSSLSSSQVCSG
jgi:hypothetical protein